MKNCNYKILLSILIVVVVSGCAPRYQSIHTNNDQRDVDRAQRLAADGDHEAAARIYMKLAKRSRPSLKDPYLYQAANSLYQGEKIKSAKKIADRINPEYLDRNDRFALRLLYGRIFLAQDQPEQTLRYLEPIPANRLSRPLELDYHEQRAEVFSRIGNHLESAREQIRVLQLGPDSGTAKSRQAAIISELSMLSNTSLVKLRPAGASPLSGWMALALLMKEDYPGSRSFDRRIREWKSDYPGHPADIPFLISNMDTQPEKFTQPEAVGVILPLSGPYAQVGEAIRQGVLIARKYNQEAPIPVRFYNSDLADPVALYRQVVGDGANVIIGPLNKKTLKALATGNQLSVPVLGLNQIPGLNIPNLYQFGLNPEDEVEQAANSAWFDGFHRAYIFAPATKQGRRLASFFSQKWKQLGGEIIRYRSYNPKHTEYSAAVKGLLQVRESVTAAKKKSEFGDSWNRRNENDFIFLVALPRQARLIKPMLQYYNAENLSVYGTSQLYTGHESPMEDQDLAGAVFCDIPWLFNSQIINTPSLNTVLASWEHPATRYVRLMALGFDAYNLLPHLNQLNSSPDQSYPGVTGRLSISDNNRIRRGLVCAEFQNGVPVPRSLSPHSSDDTRGF